MSTPLRPLQDGFQSYLLTGSARIEAQVVSDEVATAATRIEIYFDAYRLRLVEVLGNDYPALRAVLGEVAFKDLAHSYLDAFPSQTRSVRWFGRHLPEFLRTAAPYADQGVLADIAEFEWRRGEVFDERDASSMTVAQMAEVAPERWPELRFEMGPALRRIRLEWNAPAIAKAIGTGSTGPQAERAPGEWLLWRQGLDTYWRPLAGAEAAAFDAAASGASFSEICEGQLAWVAADQAALQVAGLLKRWITDGLIVRLRIAGEES